MIVYLSKSNRANPMRVMVVREFIKRNLSTAELREYNGGAYDRKMVEEADLLLMITEQDPAPIEHFNEIAWDFFFTQEDCPDIMQVEVGRGLYSEAKTVLNKEAEFGTGKALCCMFSSETDFTLHEILNAEITNGDNYIRYGNISFLAEEFLTLHEFIPKG